MWAPMALPMAPERGLKLDSAPARRSLQSLGRKVLPSSVSPWMKNSRGLGTDIRAVVGDK